MAPSSLTSRASGVDGQRAERADGARGGGGRRRAAAAARAQHGLHAADELGDAERLGDVVVGAGLEADDLVELGVLRREHQDVRVAERAHAAADLDAVDVGQADVEDDQVERRLQRGGLDGGLPVGGLVDVEALLDQQGADEHPVLGCVVDDEGARWGGGAGHGLPVSSAGVAEPAPGRTSAVLLTGLEEPDGREAVRVGEDALTYAQLRVGGGCGGRAGGRRVARGGDRRSRRWRRVVAVVGALAAGVPIVPINPKAGERELEHILCDSAPEHSSLDDGRPVAAAGELAGRASRTTRRRRSSSTRRARPGRRRASCCRGARSPRTSTRSPTRGTWTGDDVVAHGLPLFHVHGLILGVLGPLRLGGGAWHLGKFSSEAAARGAARARDDALRRADDVPPAGGGPRGVAVAGRRGGRRAAAGERVRGAAGGRPRAHLARRAGWSSSSATG